MPLAWIPLAKARKKARFFEKKRGKKLSLLWCAVFATNWAQRTKSFLVLFFKKGPLPYAWS
jgi:hypothetical protein